MKRRRIIIMGAAGRDFHNFNVLYKNDPSVEVSAFTAAQIPFIEKRSFPASLSGPLYPEGIPIYHEDELPRIVKELKIDEAVFSYSDVSYEYVMRRASLVSSLGGDFRLVGAEKTMLLSVRPVISVSAVRTGCGKSGVTNFIAGMLKKAGKKPVVIRHPMPYGDLAKERVQRFASNRDMAAAKCTIEEMEEYEHLLDMGIVVFAGVDYAEILKLAELESDVVIWDGGNNDTPFVKPGLDITVADSLRPGHEIGYYPGEVNLRRAGVVIINKVNSASPEDIKTVADNVRSVNPKAKIIETQSKVKIIGNKDICGKNVLVIEDGPTLTHGGMTAGAGTFAAAENGAVPVDPRPYAKGSIKGVLEKYPGITNLIPAMGYSEAQIKDLEETINAAPAELVLVATPIDLSRIIKINKPSIKVRYEIVDTPKNNLTHEIMDFMSKVR